MGTTLDATSESGATREELQQYQAVHKSPKPPHRKVMVMKWLLAILGAIIMMTTAGCASMNKDEFRVPGNPFPNDFRIGFQLDWKVYDSGTWIYLPRGNERIYPHKMGGGRAGYRSFNILTLDFKFKDGRVYHEEIDLRPLIAEMLKNNTIPDLRKTKWGGSVDVEIHVKADKLSLVYVITEYTRTENPPGRLYKDYRFPIFEKALN